jgi:hypothetical protein
MAALFLSLDQWADIAVIVTGFGILLVLNQVRQGRRDSQVQLVTGLTTMMLEVDRALIEHPEMRRYIGGGKATPKRPKEERERALAICMALANALDHVVVHLRYMNEESQRSWRLAIAETYAKSPVFQELLEEHADWWPGLQRQVRGLNDYSRWRTTGWRVALTSSRRRTGVV